jgi:hypothetical protein
MINVKESDYRRKILGDIGEKIVNNYMSAIGRTVEMSTDPFDSTKDMKVNGVSLEVKTQVPYCLERSFTIRKNQLNKCLNVDYFVIVQAPCEYLNESAIWKIKKGFTYNTVKLKGGGERLSIPMYQDKVIKKFDIVGEDKELLRLYSTDFAMTI